MQFSAFSGQVGTSRLQYAALRRYNVVVVASHLSVVILAEELSNPLTTKSNTL